MPGRVRKSLLKHVEGVMLTTSERLAARGTLSWFDVPQRWLCTRDGRFICKHERSIGGSDCCCNYYASRTRKSASSFSYSTIGTNHGSLAMRKSFVIGITSLLVYAMIGHSLCERKSD